MQNQVEALEQRSQENEKEISEKKELCEKLKEQAEKHEEYFLRERALASSYLTQCDSLQQGYDAVMSALRSSGDQTSVIEKESSVLRS